MPSQKRSSRRSLKTELPKIPAKDLTPGVRRKGNDGSMYRVMIRKNGVHYWQRCGPKRDGGSYCRFVGPSRPRSTSP